MSQCDDSECCGSNSGGFFLGLIIGLMVGAVIDILIYRHNKSEVVQVLKRKINKFISGLETKKSKKTKLVKKISSKSSKSHPKTFLTK